MKFIKIFHVKNNTAKCIFWPIYKTIIVNLSTLFSKAILGGMITMAGGADRPQLGGMKAVMLISACFFNTFGGGPSAAPPSPLAYATTGTGSVLIGLFSRFLSLGKDKKCS